MMCETTIRICDECASEWSCDCEMPVASFSMSTRAVISVTSVTMLRPNRVEVCVECYQEPDSCVCPVCREETE